MRILQLAKMQRTTESSDEKQLKTLTRAAKAFCKNGTGAGGCPYGFVKKTCPGKHPPRI
jgi:hypothetical protein